MQHSIMNCVIIEVFVVNINLRLEHSYVLLWILNWWQVIIDHQMIIVMKTWNKSKYLIKFVMIVEQEHILIVRFTLVIEDSTFWMIELQHISSTIIRRDFLCVAQSALQHVVRKRLRNLVRLFQNHCIDFEIS